MKTQPDLDIGVTERNKNRITKNYGQKESKKIKDFMDTLHMAMCVTCS